MASAVLSCGARSCLAHQLPADASSVARSAHREAERAPIARETPHECSLRLAREQQQRQAVAEAERQAKQRAKEEARRCGSVCALCVCDCACSKSALPHSTRLSLSGYVAARRSLPCQFMVLWRYKV